VVLHSSEKKQEIYGWQECWPDIITESLLDALVELLVGDRATLGEHF
jgi:hypothetical protein